MPPSPNGSSDFAVQEDGISDLFDGSVDRAKELVKLDELIVERDNRKVLLQLYNDEVMNRHGFHKFAEKYAELDGDTPDEIFSCSTGLFGEEEKGEGKSSLDDRLMSKPEFITGVVRMANLWTLMNEGMADASELCIQTRKFLKHCAETM